MHSDTRLGARALPRGQLLRIDAGRGRLVQCLEGRLWLTQQDDPRDIVLDAGDEAVIERDGLTVLQALGDARFVLAPARPERAPRHPPVIACAPAAGR
jgi:hypothetical protein